jgi:hypothetical protein
MAAAATDHYRKLARKWVGQIGAGGVANNTVTTIPLSSTTNLPTDTGVTVVIDRVSSTGTKTPTLEETVTGVVSGNNLISCVRGAEGTAQAHSAGAVVEALVTAINWNDQVDAMMAEHAQDGTHASSIAKLSASQTFTGSDTFTGTIVAGSGVLKAINNTSGSGVSTFPTSTGTLSTLALTETFTNKRITPRVVTTTDDATAVIDVDVTDQYQLTAVANATVFTVTGTPTNGQRILIRLKDAGVAKALTWTGFTAIGCTAPTTTVASKTHYIGCIYNSATPTWNILAVAVEA